MHWLASLGTAIVAFAATNIDDIFLITLFFAQKNLRRWHVVAGQYLGVAGLVAISLVGFFARLIIPHSWISLLGLAPILIGVKKLIDLRHGDTGKSVNESRAASVFTVAAVTFANGGDNIAIYVPLFASSDAQSLVITLITFAVMIAVWCAVGYYIGNHPVVNRAVDRYGHLLVPVVLIGLGIYILVQA